MTRENSRKVLVGGFAEKKRNGKIRAERIALDFTFLVKVEKIRPIAPTKRRNAPAAQNKIPANDAVRRDRFRVMRGRNGSDDPDALLDDGLDVQGLVRQDDVAVAAGSQRTVVGLQTDAAGGVLGGGADGAL